MVVLSFVLTIGKGMERTVLNEDFYHQVFDQTAIARIASQGLSESMSQPEEDAPDAAAGIEENRLSSSLLNQIFDQQWVKQNLPAAIGNYLAWQKGESESPVLLELDDEITQLKQDLEKESDSISDEELKQLGLEEADIAKFRQGEIEAATSELPREITIYDLDQESSPQEVKDRQESFERVYDLYRIWTLPIIILLMSAIGGLKGLFSGMKWIGVIMLVCGGLVALAALGGQGALIAGINLGVDQEATSEVFEEVVNLAAGKFAWPAAVYAGTGLILLIAGIAGGKIQRRRKNNRQTAKN